MYQEYREQLNRILIPAILIVALTSIGLWFVQRWLPVGVVWVTPLAIGVMASVALLLVYRYSRQTLRKIEIQKQEIGEKHDALQNIHGRLDQMKRLYQFSEALNFTINFDAILHLIYTNCQEVLDAQEFNIYLSDFRHSDPITVYHSKNGVRNHDKEGSNFVLTDERLLNAIEIGQIWEYVDDEGRSWLVSPLSAGPSTIGGIHVSHKELHTPFAPDVYDFVVKLAFQSASALINWQNTQSLEVRAKQFESLVDIVHTVNDELEIHTLLDLILDKAIELLDVEAGSFLMVDSTTGELEFVAVQGDKRDELLHTRLPFGRGIAGQVAQNNLPKITNAVEKSDQWYSGVDAMTHFKTQSMLTVPMEYNREVLGVLQVVNRADGSPFVESDQLLLTAFANAAAVSLENARLHHQTDQELQARVEELSLLQQVDQDLSTNLEMQATGDRALEWMMRLFGATAGCMTIFTEEGELLGYSQTGYGLDLGAIEAGIHNFPGIIGRTLKTGQPYAIPHVADEPDYVAGSPTTKSMMAVPIVQDQNVIGAFSVESDQDGLYSDEDLQNGVAYVNHISMALANSRIYHQVTLANYAKSEFVSLVSHELKNPLTSIKGYGDLLLSGMTGGKLAPQQETFVQTILGNVGRMERLVKDLTDVSRIDTGQFNIDREPIPMATVVSETANIIQSLASEKDIEIHLELLPKSPIVMADQARLVQVLTNLMSNACKYSPRDSNVYVSLSNGNGVVKCTVKDEGFGIAKEEQQKLFAKFFRSKNPDIRQSNGTGLGLSISKAIVELHEGEIGFESELGEGSTFWFTVPVAA